MDLSTQEQEPKPKKPKTIIQMKEEFEQTESDLAIIKGKLYSIDRESTENSTAETLRLKEIVVMLERALEGVRAELVGVLRSQINMDRMVDERVLVISKIQRGLLNAIDSMHKKEYPAWLIAICVLGLGVIVLLAVNPEYADSAQKYFTDPQNQTFIIIILAIIAVITYFGIVKRKK